MTRPTVETVPGAAPVAGAEPRPDAGLTAVRGELFGAMFVLLQNLSQRADAELARFDLTSRQWLLLAVLATRFGPGVPTLSEAAAAYGTSRQNVKQIACQLADRGYLTLEPDAGDRRVTRLRLTGRHAVFDEPAVAAEQAAFLAGVFGGLSPAQTRTLRDLVVRCVDHLQPTRKALS